MQYTVQYTLQYSAMHCYWQLLPVAERSPTELRLGNRVTHTYHANYPAQNAHQDHHYHHYCDGRDHPDHHDHRDYHTQYITLNYHSSHPAPKCTA